MKLNLMSLICTGVLATVSSIVPLNAEETPMGDVNSQETTEETIIEPTTSVDELRSAPAAPVEKKASPGEMESEGLVSDEDDTLDTSESEASGTEDASTSIIEESGENEMIETPESSDSQSKEQTDSNDETMPVSAPATEDDESSFITQ